MRGNGPEMDQGDTFASESGPWQPTLRGRRSKKWKGLEGTLQTSLAVAATQNMTCPNTAVPKENSHAWKCFWESNSSGSSLRFFGSND